MLDNSVFNRFKFISLFEKLITKTKQKRVLFLLNYNNSSVSLVTQLCPTPCNPMDYSTPGFPIHHPLLEPTQTHVHRVGDAIQPSHTLVPVSSCLQSFPASGSFQMSQFSASGGQSIGSFSFNMSPSNEHPGLISFRMDWLDLLAVQGTLKNLLQCHTSKSSILWHSAFFMVQVSHPYMTTGKP